MQDPDESDLAYWKRREREERASAAACEGQVRIAHLELADGYATLTMQAKRTDGSRLDATQ